MKIPENIGSKYRYIILAGQRVAQLQRGAIPRVDRPDGLKMTDIALKELEDGELAFHKIGEKAETSLQANAEEPAPKAKATKAATAKAAAAKAAAAKAAAEE